MNTAQEVELAHVPGDSATERMLIVLRQDHSEGSRIEMRQQSWALGIGWFTQSSVQIEPSQLADVRAALGGRATPSAIGDARPRAIPGGFRPRVVHADSA